jgi:hypothetical protein
MGRVTSKWQLVTEMRLKIYGINANVTRIEFPPSPPKKNNKYLKKFNLKILCYLYFACIMIDKK